MGKTPRSRPITSTLAFSAAVGGELYLVRGLLGEGLASLPGILLAELGFCVLIAAAAVFTATPRGWRSKTGSCAAFALYAAYLLFNILNFHYFRNVYLSAVLTEHQSYGAALETLKLVLVLIGAVAAMPVMPGPEGREYLRGLERAARKQQMQWAGKSAAGTKSDLEKTVRHFRQSLSPEELEELVAQLKQEGLEQEGSGQSGQRDREG